MNQHYKSMLGGMTEKEAEKLSLCASIAPLKRILEIGTFCGKSASVLAEHAETLICVDLFPANQKYWGAALVIPEPLKSFWATMSSLGYADRVISLKGDTKNILPQLNGKFGMIYVDGGHTMKDVLPNALWAWGHLVKDGFLCFHDYGNKKWEDIRIVVDCLSQKWGVSVEIVGTLATIRKGNT